MLFGRCVCVSSVGPLRQCGDRQRAPSRFGLAMLSFESAEEEEQALLSAAVSDEQLAVLTGTRDLASIRFLQMAVDSEFVPLSCLGERLPALEHLKLNGSRLTSLRHLGTTLTNLQVLWLCRCGLSELDNLGALPQLQVCACYRWCCLSAQASRATRGEAGVGGRPGHGPRAAARACPPRPLSRRHRCRFFPRGRRRTLSLGGAPPSTGAVLGVQRHQYGQPTDGGRPAAGARPRGEYDPRYGAGVPPPPPPVWVPTLSAPPRLP